jgi:cytosine/uracil/thiamine/allantoin permease
VPLLRWADDHPVAATLIVAVVVFVGLHIWSTAHDGPLLLARAEPDARLTLYGQVTATAVALLGISLTVLAILLALPDRPAIADIRESDTWPRLQGLLLMVGLLALAALISAHVAAAVDDRQGGIEWLEQIVLACSATTALALLIAGVTFWLVLREADGPEDPSRGRGQGP